MEAEENHELGAVPMGDSTIYVEAYRELVSFCG
jgi:hypothetical protein